MCEDGWISTEERMHECKPCLPGHFCEKPKGGYPTLKMTPCPEGEYQDIPGQTSCKKCGPGSFCPKQSYTNLYCDAGYFLENVSKPCTICLPGHECPLGGNITVCSAGTYAPAGTDKCITCPAGSFCKEGFAAPVQCNVPDTCLAGSTENN